MGAGVLVWLVLFGSMPEARATMSSTAPVGTGKIVKGCCKSACAYTIGRIASPRGVRKAWDWFDDTLSDQIEDTGESLKEGDQKIPALLNKQFENQNALFRPLVSGYGFGRQKTRNFRNFGPQSKAYSHWQRPDFLIGQQGEGKFDDRLRLGIEDYKESFETNSQIAARLQEVKESQIDPQSVFPSGGTLAKDQVGSLRVSLETLVDAFPETAVPENFQDSKAHDDYRAVRSIGQFRSRAAEAILAEVMSGYIPAVPAGEEIKKIQGAAGGKNDPAEIQDGRMSPVGMLGFLVKSRFANDDYRTGEGGIHSMSSAGLLREMADLKALRMAIKQRQLRRSQQIAFLAALQSSGREAAKSLELNRALNTVLEDN